MGAAMSREAYIRSLFTGADQRQNFQTMDTIFPVGRMSASPEPFVFPRAAEIALPANYRYEGKSRSIDSFLEETETMALLVLKGGVLVFERYAPWGGRDRRWKSMSVAKSVISASLGIAVGTGLVATLDDSISSYLPELSGSAYDGVRIKDVLQMSSGAGWNEDYSDPDSDINRFAAITAKGGSFNGFPPTLKRATEPGTFNFYNSTDTQVLGMLLKRVTARPIHAYIQDVLWHPLGMESEAFWLLDDTGMEMAYAGLNATALDYLKIGELFRLGGCWQGHQIVPNGWVKASITPDAPHLMPGDTSRSDSLWGYGYQWWIMDGTEGEFAAVGVYNQFIYVNPARDIVMVKLSANRRYGLTNDETSYRELETIEALREIAIVASGQ